MKKSDFLTNGNNSWKRRSTVTKSNLICNSSYVSLLPTYIQICECKAKKSQENKICKKGNDSWKSRSTVTKVELDPFLIQILLTWKFSRGGIFCGFFLRFCLFRKNYPHAEIKSIRLYEGNRSSVVKNTPTWNVLPTYILAKFSPSKNNYVYSMWKHSQEKPQKQNLNKGQ